MAWIELNLNIYNRLRTVWLPSFCLSVTRYMYISCFYCELHGTAYLTCFTYFILLYFLTGLEWDLFSSEENIAFFLKFSAQSMIRNCWSRKDMWVLWELVIDQLFWMTVERKFQLINCCNGQSQLCWFVYT